MELDPHSEHSPSLNRYREYVQAKSATDGPGEVFLNRTLDHAAIIIEFLFRKASRQMEILTGSLNENVYCKPKTLEAVNDFLAKDDAKMAIILENNIQIREHGLFKLAADSNATDKISWHLVPTNMIPTYKYHFALSDGCHFRFEQDRKQPEALVQFNNCQIGGNLHSIFEDIRGFSRKLRV